MTDQRMLAVIMDDIKKIIGMLSTDRAEIEQLKEEIKPIDELVAWRNRWAGALIALSGVAMLVSFIVGIKVFF
jgi:hypothetical protein